MNDVGVRAHALKHSHGRCFIGSFDKIYMKALFGMVIELFYSLSYTNQYLFTLCIMVQDFMKNDYINDKRIRRTYSGRKRKATGTVMLKYLHSSDYVFMMLSLMLPQE